MTCEAQERIDRALFILENDWGEGRIDLTKMKHALTGDDCNHEEKQCQH